MFGTKVLNHLIGVHNVGTDLVPPPYLRLGAFQLLLLLITLFKLMKDGLADGTIDCIATDHAPHHIDEKFQEFDLAPFGITGLQTLIPLTLNLVRSGVITENEMAKLCSYTPAKLLKLDNKGAVAEGMLADLTVIDTELEYTFNKELNRSKGVNSPFMITLTFHPALLKRRQSVGIL